MAVTRGVRAFCHRAGLAGLCLALFGGGVAAAGQMGHWTLRAMGGAAAQTQPEFAPVRGPLLHVSSGDAATALGTCELPDVGPPYVVSWWLYAADTSYDDFIVYQAQDEGGSPADVVILFGEKPEKMPASPDEWQGAIWVEDGKGRKSVAALLRRPGWHKLEVGRTSAAEVSVKLNGEGIGIFQARGQKPARRVEVGDPDATEGSGEAYWTPLTITCGQPPATREIAWTTKATGAGMAEYGAGLDDVQHAHLYLRNRPGKAPSRCEVEWSTIEVAIPYYFWCQVYVSEEPYRGFSVLRPETAEGKATDVEVQFDDAASGAGGAEEQTGFVWVVDANGRHPVGSVTRGVWHEFAIRRRKPREVDLLVDGRPLGSFASRSPESVACYRFGDFASDQQRGEVYLYRLRLVPVPKD